MLTMAVRRQASSSYQSNSKDILTNNPSFTILVAILVIAAFYIGSLTQKVNNLESQGRVGGTAPAGQAQAPVVTPGPLHLAKAIGIDADKFKSCLESGKYTKQVADELAEGQKAGVNGTPATFINGQLVSGAQPYTTFKTIIDGEIANPNQPLPSGTRATVDVGGFPIMGDQNAQVTIVEFADFQCPFCEKFYSATEPSIIKDYVKTGKAKFAFRNYAFLGPESNTAAEGAYCAQDQGKFWEYHNFLYQHQGQENSGTFSKVNLES